MKAIFPLLCLLASVAAHAFGIDGSRPIFFEPVSNDLSIRVLQYVDILAPGTALRCFLDEKNQFGYLAYRNEAGAYIVEVISNGREEGEKTRAVAELKDYGSPFIVYLSVHKREGDYGSYFELLLEKKFNGSAGALTGASMFTEAYYSIVDGKEKETFKPVAKRALRCYSETRI